MSLSSMLLSAAVVDATIGLSVVIVASLLFHRRLRITFLSVGFGVGTALLAGAVQATVLLDDGFSKLHMAYLVTVVSLPLIGAALLVMGLAARWTARLEMTRPGGVLAVGLLGLGVVGFWGTHIEPYRLRTDEAALDIRQLGPADDPIRVGVLADLQTRHIGDHERRAVERLNGARPDIVLLPGDYIQGNEKLFLAELPALRELLGTLDAPGGVFIVAGDSDSPQRITRIAEGTRVRALDNEVDVVEIRGRQVWIGGLSNQYSQPDAARAIDALARSGKDADVRIMVSHRPDAGYLVGDSGRIDLVVAGHTHGGQVALPWIGPPITLSDVPRSVGAGGLHDLDGQPIYVHSGVGMERSTAPQVRFLVPPSVGLVELR